MEQSKRWRHRLLAVGLVGGGAMILCGCGGSGSQSASAQADARKKLVQKRTAVKTEVQGEQPMSHPPTPTADEP
jgi:hypothetical protein